MREILFRGKHYKTGEWVYGYYYTQNEYHCIRNDNERPENMDCVVDPETVGQWTGLRDKNGVKIFEGDIVNMRLPQAPVWIMCKVIYNEDRASFLFKRRGGWTYDMYDVTRSYYEVKGNKWDNPELLEVKG